MRIASLQPSISLTLKALGSLDALCACTKYCVDALPELASAGIPILHDSWTANTAEILESFPDLVLASVPYRMESLAAILKTGRPVLALAPHALADIYKDIRLIASIVCVGDEGEAVVRAMQAAVEDVRRTAAHEVRPLVYCEEWGKPLIHSQHWVAELVEASGGRFLGEPGSHTTAEIVAGAQPDVVIFAWCGAGDRVPLEKVISQRGWTEMEAVRLGRVHCVPDELLNTPSPTLVEGLACLAGICHPEKFARDRRVRSLREKPVWIAAR